MGVIETVFEERHWKETKENQKTETKKITRSWKIFRDQIPYSIYLGGWWKIQRVAQGKKKGIKQKTKQDLQKKRSSMRRSIKILKSNVHQMTKLVKEKEK